MTKIFISYRRADSQYVVDSIAKELEAIFGHSNVFLDVGSIPFGVDFREYLNKQIAIHDVLLVIIGKDWAQIMKERSRQRDDFVRIEIESALQQNKLVIPVLVKDADMPNFSQLPESIHDLQWRNSATIRRRPYLETDCARLIQGIQQYFGTTTTVRPTQNSNLQNVVSTELMPPPFDWIEIPSGGINNIGGTYKYKSLNFEEVNDVSDIVRLFADQAAERSDKRVSKSANIARFAISKYSITNAQFRKFMDADGYNKRQWWTDEGWNIKERESWKQPQAWYDSDWNDDAQPVIGISWFEAVAFCKWLSQVTNENINLPSDAQWQYAAQGIDGLEYPWGNSFHYPSCNHNVDQKGIGKTTTVTRFESTNISPFKVVDMIGNIWEWCLTD
ncbi:MAG: SUMF1/EgtB/PvdO family nonheme iron enzyme, partial [Bacteroidota bacterium]